MAKASSLFLRVDPQGQLRTRDKDSLDQGSECFCESCLKLKMSLSISKSWEGKGIWNPFKPGSEAGLKHLGGGLDMLLRKWYGILWELKLKNRIQDKYAYETLDTWVFTPQ